MNPKQIAKDLDMQASIDANKLLKNNSFLIPRLAFMEKLDNFDNSYAVVILTEWEEYSNIDWNKISGEMVILLHGFLMQDL